MLIVGRSSICTELPGDVGRKVYWQWDDNKVVPKNLIRLKVIKWERFLTTNSILIMSVPNLKSICWLQIIHEWTRTTIFHFVIPRIKIITYYWIESLLAICYIVSRTKISWIVNNGVMRKNYIWALNYCLKKKHVLYIRWISNCNPNLDVAVTSTSLDKIVREPYRGSSSNDVYSHRTLKYTEIMQVK